MKNKIVTTLIIGILSVATIACGSPDSDQPESTETTAETEESVEAESEPTEEPAPEEKDPAAPIVLENGNGKLEYTSFSIGQDYEGKPTLILNFNYTNLSTESKSALWEYNITTFQNGVECEIAMVMDSTEGLDNAMKEIQTGTTLPVSFAYVLQDTTSPVSLEANELVDFDDPVKQELALQ